MMLWNCQSRVLGCVTLVTYLSRGNTSTGERRVSNFESKHNQASSLLLPSIGPFWTSLWHWHLWTTDKDVYNTNWWFFLKTCFERTGLKKWGVRPRGSTVLLPWNFMFHCSRWLKKRVCRPSEELISVPVVTGGSVSAVRLTWHAGHFE